jgi:hypothetical protein
MKRAFIATGVKALLLVGVMAGIVAVFEGLPVSQPEASGRAEVTDTAERIQALENRIAELEQQRSMLQDSAPVLGPVSYTYQQLYETRAEGPSRPECEAVRQRAARNVPNWMELNFISAFGCLTPTEERLRRLENESLYPPPAALEPYKYPAEQGFYP